MHIVTDSGADLSFEECKQLGIHMLPLKVEVDGISYQSGVDITPERFYELMDSADNMPKTSTPSVGEFLDLYNKLAEDDPQILSVHISSGLSGTSNTARTAAKLAEKAQVTIVDTLSLSAGTQWQVLAAVALARAGETIENIVAKLKQIQEATLVHFTLPDLKYLIAGGRISHLKGMLASILGIKPIIQVDPVDGKYYDKAKVRSYQKAIYEIPRLLLKYHSEGAKLKAQIATAANSEGGKMLREAMDQVFSCDWLPETSIGTALGAHTGRGLVGVIVGEKKALPEIPAL